MTEFHDEEEWLSFDEVVTLVLEREPMSLGRAEAVVRTARKSGEIRYTAALTDAGTWYPVTYSKNDLLDWLDRHSPVTKTTAPASRVELSGNSAPAEEMPPQPKPRRRQLKRKVLQEAAEQRLLSVFAESGGVPPADLGPTAITERVNEDLSPGKQFLRDTVTRAVKSLKEKPEQNQ
jgi:hypothetical protein